MVTGLAAGVSVEAAVSHGMVGLTRRPRDGTRIAFAVAAAAVAVGAVAVVAMYSADSAEAHAAIMKWLLFPASTVWTVAVVWLVAFSTDVRPRRFLSALTAAFAAMLVVDLAPAPGTPSRRGRGAAADGHGGRPRDGHRRGRRRTRSTASRRADGGRARVPLLRPRRGAAAAASAARPPTSASRCSLFALSMLVDILTDYGVITSFYTTPLFFAGVVLVTSVALRRESLRDEAELRRYRTELESLVEERVADLDQANAQLAEENRVRVAAEEALRRRVAELDALQHLSQTLASRTDLASALEQASGEIAALLHSAGASIRLTTEASSAAAAPAAASTGDETAETLSVPMVARGTVVGVLDVVRDAGGPPFSVGEEKVAQTVADALAAVVENERLHERDTKQAAVRERQHLARELHDAVTQTIYSATLIADALPEVWEREPDEGRRSLVTLRRLVHGALAEMRTLLFELRPGALARGSARHAAREARRRAVRPDPGAGRGSRRRAGRRAGGREDRALPGRARGVQQHREALAGERCERRSHGRRRRRQARGARRWTRIRSVGRRARAHGLAYHAGAPRADRGDDRGRQCAGARDDGPRRVAAPRRGRSHRERGGQP